MSARIRVVLADDHQLMRTMVRRALEDDGFDVVAEAADADGAVNAAIEHRPDLCLLDLVMPGDGAAAALRIDTALPGTRIVMLTASSNEDDLFRCVRAGAMGYLLKDTDPARLTAALRGVLNGEASIPRALVARLVSEFRDRNRRLVPTMRRRGLDLSEREWDVLERLREGRTTKEIALEFELSDVTVRRHISTMVKKLGVADRAAAIDLLEETERRRQA